MPVNNRKFISTFLALQIAIACACNNNVWATESAQPANSQTPTDLALAAPAIPQPEAKPKSTETQSVDIHKAHISKSDIPLVETYLLDGQLAAGEQALLAKLKRTPKDD